mmetsp:Transcript_823/g.1096  ORF Transcript_823/g.1096 Transcript_823/m.1096 type:complete len:351 (+) Transcript_823:100-1152(+)
MISSALRFLTSPSTTIATRTATSLPRRVTYLLALSSVVRAFSPSSSTTAAAADFSSWSSSCALFSSPENEHQRAMSSSAASATAAPFIVEQFPCLTDNYGFLIHDETTGDTAAIDTPDAAAYEKVLKEKGWTLTHILNTHHHHDHTGGNKELCKLYPQVKVYGPATEQIPNRHVALKEGDTVDFGSSSDANANQLKIMDVGGHTKGHIAFYNSQVAFVGDSLFALGCGRMFEGTPTQFWTSLTKLRSTLTDDTLVYCAHEYTAANAKFALSVEPSNTQLVHRVQEITELRAQNKPTVPSTMKLEKETNPFLRCDISKEIQQNVGIMELPTTGDYDFAQVFAKVRAAKDTF